MSINNENTGGIRIVRATLKDLKREMINNKKIEYNKSCFGEYRDKDGNLCGQGAIGRCEYNEECKRNYEYIMQMK